MDTQPEINRLSLSASVVPPKSSVFGLLLKILGGLGLFVVAAALLLPATRSAREPARRSQCKNNLMQIGFALHSYADAYGALPPAYTTDRYGYPLHSWRTLILPYMDQEELFKKIDLSKPWDDPVNAEAFQARVNPYRCPSVQLPDNMTTYLAINTPGGCFRPNESRQFSDITDSTAETLMVIEVPGKLAVPWMSTMDADEDLVLSFGPESELSHTSGTHALFVDGHIQHLPADSSAADRRAWISIAGGEAITAD